MSTGLKARLLGVLFLGLGAFAFWNFGLHPLEEARAGAKEVTFSVKVFVASPIALIAGLAFLVGGAPVLEWFRKQPKTRLERVIGGCVLMLALAAGFIAYVWFRRQLAALGYRALF